MNMGTKGRKHNRNNSNTAAHKNKQTNKKPTQKPKTKNTQPQPNFYSLHNGIPDLNPVPLNTVYAG